MRRGLGRVLAAVSRGSAGLYKLLSHEYLIRSAYKQFGIPPAYQPLLHDDLLVPITPEFVRRTTQLLVDTGATLPREASNPTLVTLGTRETPPAKHAARTPARVIPGARGQGYYVQGVGHVWNLQDAGLFTATLRAWLTEQPLPARLRPFR